MMLMVLKYFAKGLISVFGVFIKPFIGKPAGEIKPRRIAILLWGGIGNHILFSPALYAIRGRFPHAKIAICSFQHFAEELFSQTADRFLTIGENPSMRSIRRMIFLLGEYRPDAVISNAMSPTFLSSYIAYLSGARIRIGIDRFSRGSLNNIRIRPRGCHEVELNRSLASSLTDSKIDPLLRFDFSEEDAKIATHAMDELLDGPKGEMKVAIQPGSGRTQSFKRWEKEKFRDLIQKLLQMGIRVVVIGTEEEREELRFIQRSVEHKNLKFLRSPLTLSQISLAIKNFDLLVANDTSLVHLAAASGIPSVVIFGPTDPQKNKPWGVSSRVIRKEMDCAPCYRYTIPRCRRGFRCLRDVSVAEVFDAVKEILEEKHSRLSHLDIDRLLDQ